MYEGNMNVKRLIDQTNEVDKYFDYEDIDEEKRVKYVMNRLQCHIELW